MILLYFSYFFLEIDLSFDINALRILILYLYNGKNMLTFLMQIMTHGLLALRFNFDALTHVFCCFFKTVPCGKEKGNSSNF